MIRYTFGTVFVCLVLIALSLEGAKADEFQKQEFQVEDMRFKGNDLSSNRYESLKGGTLQASFLYDGQGTVSVKIEIINGKFETEWITISDVPSFERYLPTYEFQLNPSEEPTGCIYVEGVKPNGVIDGLAWGIFFKNEEGQYKLFQSRDEKSEELKYVGSWPLGVLHNGAIKQRAPQLTSDFGKEQLRLMLFGSQLRPDGLYCDYY